MPSDYPKNLMKNDFDLSTNSSNNYQNSPLSQEDLIENEKIIMKEKKFIE